MNSKGTLLIDLDDTLLYTQKLKATLDALVRDAGVPDDIAQKAMKEFRAQNNDHVDFRAYAKFLKAQYNHEIPETIIESVYELPLKEYLKGNVVETINELKNRGYDVHIVSKGSPDFQMYKIRNSGLHDLFYPNIHLCIDKKECIKSLELEKPVTLINDRLKETHMIRSEFPEFRYIHVNRDDDHGLYTPQEIDLESIDTVDDLLSKFL